MSPTRRDTLKAAGAASGLAMLGGHAIAQEGGPGADDGDGPGAQQLEEGEAGVRFGHFVAGAPAVNVRLVPADDTGEMDTDDGTPAGTDNETGGNETGGNDTNDTNATNDTDEDLQVGNDTNDTDNDTDDGLFGNDTNDTNDTDDGVGVGNDTNDTNDTDVGAPDDTDDGEGELIAENVSFGDVSEYANVEAGDYTLRVLEAVEETTDMDGGADGNATGNETNESNDSISLPPDLDDDNDTNDTNDTAGNNTSGNDTDEDLQVGNDTNDTNDTDDGLFGNDTNDTNATNDTDVGNDTNDTNDTDVGAPEVTDGEVIYEEDITVSETYYTVAAVGTGADDIQAHVLQDYDAAQVRLVHASPDAPVVDVVAPDATMTLFDGVGFGQATEYVGVPPGSYSLSVREEAELNDGDEVLSEDVELESGEAYSVYAVGSPEGGEEEFQLVVEQDGQGADAGLGQEGAPGQQPGGPGGNETDNETAGPPGDNETGGPPGDNETGGPGGEGPPGQDDNETGGPGGN